jgi:zinc transport system ATP-binding protein
MEANVEPVLKIQNLYAGYGDEDIIKNINLNVFPGDFIGIIGPNGGGKTTLLRTILGILTPRSGIVRVLGKDALQGRKRIGYVPQFVETDRDFPISVWDTVRMGLLDGFHFFERLTPDQSRSINEALDHVSMLDLKKEHMGNLSGGQRQRVFIARALISGPLLLLLDEPTASIDPNTTRDIYELFHELNKRMAILLISHDMLAVASYTKTIACLNRELVYHNSKELSEDIREHVYGCPIDLIAHGIPHRVYSTHPESHHG